MLKDITLDLINSFSRQTLWLLLVIVICLISLSSVQSQPLHLPAEPFKCGSHNSCERWGYTACVNKDKESYCLPCYHDYLKSLCRTKNEEQGCNLYCLQEALATEKENMRVQLMKEKNAVYVNLHEVQTELDLSQNETDKLRRKKTSLDEELDGQHSYNKSLEIGIAVLSAIMLIGIVGVCVVFVKLDLVRLYKMHQEMKKTNNDVEDLGSSLLDESKLADRLSKYSDESGLGNDTASSAVTDILTQSSDFGKESVETGQERDKANQCYRCAGDDCNGNAKLKNIPPTSSAAEDDSSKLAIR